jgi:L-methionine (R)-S-oxide reductase
MTDYALLQEQARCLLAGESHPLPSMANLAALLWQSLEGLNWAGFYVREGDGLVLGPFQGKPACIRIPLGRGVCGTAAALDAPQRVEDVRRFPGHIACDAASRSELVIPLHAAGQVVGVLDLDSPLPARFAPEDAAGLAAVARVLESAWDWGRWNL